jgi:effector-binding domain-containing protein
MKLYFSIFILGISLIACNDDKNKDKIKPTVLVKKDVPLGKNDTITRSAPIINITDTTENNLYVLCFKDSAVNTIRLSEKLGIIYGQKIDSFLKKSKISPIGPPMAWYKSQKAPFFFEAGIAVAKKISKLPKGAYFKKLGGTRVVVAHFHGPYEETVQAYQVLKEWLADAHKKQNGAPYEIYVDDPVDEKGNVKDPYKVQTDIVIPYR